MDQHSFWAWIKYVWVSLKFRWCFTNFIIKISLVLSKFVLKSIFLHRHGPKARNFNGMVFSVKLLLSAIYWFLLIHFDSSTSFLGLHEKKLFLIKNFKKQVLIWFQFPAMQRLSITKAHAFILVFSIVSRYFRIAFATVVKVRPVRRDSDRRRVARLLIKPIFHLRLIHSPTTR